MPSYIRNVGESRGSTQPLAREGEAVAAEFLAHQGHTVLERNWRSGHLEVDIITFDSGGVHIVEVKTRREPFMLDPQDCVDAKKQKRLVRAATAYMRSACPKHLKRSEILFDIVSVTFAADGKKTVKYFPGAWIPMYF